MKPFDPRLARLAAPVRRLLAASIGLGIAGAIAVIAQAVLLAGVLSSVIVDGADLAAVTTRLGWLAAVVLIRAGLSWASEVLARTLAASATAELRRETLTAVAQLGPRWRGAQTAGGLTSLLTAGADGLDRYLGRYLPALVLAAMVPLGMLVVLWVADPLTGIIVAVTLPLIPLFMAIVGWYTDRVTARRLRTLTRLSAHFADVVAGLPTLVVFGRARAQAGAVRKVTDEYRTATMATLRVSFLSSMVLELIATLSVALVAVSAGIRLIGGSLTLQVALTVLILAPEAYLPLRTLGTRYHAAADGTAAVSRMLELIDAAEAAAPTAVPVPVTSVPTPPALRLRGVAVDFGERRRVELPDLDLAAGRVTVLLGPSGLGKSTALRLLAGLDRPDAGRVEVRGSDDWLDLGALDGDAWRSGLAWSGQQVAVLPGTVWQNLELAVAGSAIGMSDDTGTDELRASAGGSRHDHRLGTKTTDIRRFSSQDDDHGRARPYQWTDVAPSDGALAEAMRVAGVDEFVDALPAGLDTVLGDDGAGLSAGQLRRLGLARALLADRFLMLLDEPTAGLDEAAEARLVARLGPALSGRTVVITSHRPQVCALADVVVDLTRPVPAGRPAPASPAINETSELVR